MKTRIELLRDITEGKQAQKIRVNGRKVLVDMFTASACVAVYDALNAASREVYTALPWEKFISVTWRLVK